MQNKIYFLTGAAIIILSTYLYITKLQHKLSEMEHQVFILEEQLKINPQKMEKVIEYRDKKIEVIKETPVYIDKTDTCEGLKNELEITKNIINSF